MIFGRKNNKPEVRRGKIRKGVGRVRRKERGEDVLGAVVREDIFLRGFLLEVLTVKKVGILRLGLISSVCLAFANR